eukprot:CAMPEP_0171094798 /NCGR_PEP_ID=MMETSP0766_2-20121228/42404_1 /TAXON_ID=439317 /ORGANISM="Gambierdiscus australes, Strain CAWD 149" /LENGTH=46 /DNA_ID= /DNA_START= /DNA_END= /DNA_ORIENTATION=
MAAICLDSPSFCTRSKLLLDAVLAQQHLPLTRASPPNGIVFLRTLA